LIGTALIAVGFIATLDLARDPATQTQRGDVIVSRKCSIA
jgi:hypothetical protein